MYQENEIIVKKRLFSLGYNIYKLVHGGVPVVH